jgi:hypothetical protein
MELFESMQEHGEVNRAELRDAYISRHGTGEKYNDRKRFNHNIRKLIEEEMLQQNDEVLSRAE